MRWKYVVLWTTWLCGVVRQPTPLVVTQQGLLRGDIASDGSHVRYMGIPYASIPHRFQAPGPAPTWDRVYEAVDQHVRCQQAVENTFVVGQADCLVLNVYTPLDVTQNAPLPVMVFIHGGGYFSGSGTSLIYGPDYLVRKDIVLVTFNYRLNIQGFLCLGIKEAQGNAAMKDQVAALKWVQRNIRAFGGDPDNVTLFGESAGSASVSYHIVSPMSKGLFHKAILQSGSSLAAWAYQYKPVYMASLLAKTMGYNTEDPQKLYELFSKKSDSELILTRVPRKEGDIVLSELLYVPCTEEKSIGEEPFLSDAPQNLYAKGKYNKVPMIIGFNVEEGYFMVGLENDTTISKMAFEKSLPKNLVFDSEEDKLEIARRLKDIYLGGANISKENIVNLSRLHGEPFLTYPSIAETELILKSSDKPVYNYIFNYDGWRNLPKLALGIPFAFAPGATHADDLFYLFSQFWSFTTFETEAINKMTTLWTNFAKYGDPTPSTSALLPVKWLPSLPSNLRALMIDKHFSMVPLWFRDSLKYWHEVYKKYQRKYVYK